MATFECGTEAEFRQAVERLNCLFPETRGFNRTTARKDHTDLFGVPIAEREDYYNRDLGGFGNEIKLSERSMDRLCVAVLWGNRGLCASADNAMQERRKELADPMRKVSEGD